MPSFEHLDALIGEALECADAAAGEVRELGLAPVDRHLKSIGHAIISLWQVRDALYKAHPEVKRDFVSEYEVDQVRFDALTEKHLAACELENAGNRAEAAALFRQLHDESTFGYFKLCAEAGMFRTQDASKA